VKTRRWILGAVFATVWIVTGCDNPPAETIAPAQPLEETFQDFGDFEVHYNALRTDSLTPEVARAYGIQRGANRVMLTVTILRKEADRAPRKPVEGDVEVDAYNLNGQLKNLEMRRLSEGDAIYYIGEVTISGNEILVFDISATPSGAPAPLRVKLKREFYSN
jgi:Domain of unknown function (DUF4426)